MSLIRDIHFKIIPSPVSPLSNCEQSLDILYSSVPGLNGRSYPSYRHLYCFAVRVLNFRVISATLEVSEDGSNMENKIRVMILDDHQSIVDGYVFRLKDFPQIEVIATLAYGEQLEPALKKQMPDVLLLDVNVPVSADNSNPYPILHVIPQLLQLYPKLVILVISMHAERGIIRAVMESGADGYILKDDQKVIQDLGNVIQSVVNGGIYLSEKARKALIKGKTPESNEYFLTDRQLEAISLCAAYPNVETAKLALQMMVANSTFRNLLSGAYLRLRVNTRAAAIAKARQLGLITPDSPVHS